jgi:hypothetical protein
MMGETVRGEGFMRCGGSWMCVLEGLFRCFRCTSSCSINGFICLAVISFVLSRGECRFMGVIGSCLMQPCCDSVVKLKQAG